MNWALDCERVNVNSLDVDDLRFHPANEIVAFLRALRDPGVAADLSALERPKDNPKVQEKIKSLLSSACFFLSHSRAIVIATPSAARKELRALAKAADKLAGSIHKNEILLWPATNLTYLSQRATSQKPQGFMLQRRAGLRAGLYVQNDGKRGLVEILEAFSADIKEELAVFPKRVDKLDGGKDAVIRYQTRLLKMTYKNLFGDTNAEAIARLLTALNNIEINADRVRKSKR